MTNANLRPAEGTRERLRRLSAVRGRWRTRRWISSPGCRASCTSSARKTLFGRGDPYGGMFVVLDGLAVVYKQSDDGRMLILQVCRPGDTSGR